MNVAITGELWLPRPEVAKMIDATRNGRWVRYINLETHYLVCAEQGTQKAKKAARYGTALISEAGLREILAAGEFPDTRLPQYTPHHSNNFPDIEWTEIYDPARRGILVYRDAFGHESTRTVVVTGRGVCGDHEYFAAYDGPGFRTFRLDRVIDLQAIT